MGYNQLDFFLGAVSPSGFSSYFSQALSASEAPNPILLKGGPGCGKSTLLRRIAQHLLYQGETVQAIHCASDPSSLDGVLCKNRLLCAIDATAPHCLEPKYPVAVENVISIYDALDQTMLQNASKEIVQLFEQCKSYTERASRYITAAGSLLQDSTRVASCFTDNTKATAFAHALGKRYLPLSNSGQTEEVRLLSAVTLHGITFYSETIPKLADTIVVLHDDFGAASKTILRELRSEALAKHHSIITCYCSLSPYEKIEHLFIPELRLAFVTSNPFHTIEFEDQRNIRCTRFCNQDGLKQRIQRLRFNRKAAKELLQQASEMLSLAKENHDMLEDYYKSACDFKVLDHTYRAIIQSL